VYIYLYYSAKKAFREALSPGFRKKIAFGGKKRIQPAILVLSQALGCVMMKKESHYSPGENSSFPALLWLIFCWF
jgi:hypothetical protein